MPIDLPKKGRYYTMGELAKVKGCSLPTIGYAVSRGRLRAVYADNHKLCLIAENDAAKWEPKSNYQEAGRRGWKQRSAPKPVKAESAPLKA